MAKFFSILAASVGGGLVLGASIRLGEAIGSSAIGAHRHSPGREPANGRAPASGVSPTHVSHVHADPLIAARLERLEEKLAQVNSGLTVADTEPATSHGAAADWHAALSGVVARIDRQQSEVETMRYQISKATRAMDSMSTMAEDLRSELHRSISQDLDHRLTAIEEGFLVSMEAANRETVEAMVASIETRVAPRISRLEADLAGQTSAVSELRECALQSERSIQRLLGVLERVMNPPGHGTTTQLFGINDTKLTAVGSTPGTTRGTGSPDDAAAGIGELRRPHHLVR